jgi:hypothetical protein
MKVYVVKADGLAPCTWDDLNPAVEEARELLEEGAARVTIGVVEMTEEEYEALPEFEGY